MISTLKFSGVKYKTFLLTVTLKLIKMCLDFAVESGQKNNCLNLILAHNLYSRAVPVHIKKKRPTYVRQRLNSKRSIKKKRCRFSVDKLQPWFLSWKMKMNECWVNICVWVCVNIKSVFVQKSFMEENILKDGKQGVGGKHWLPVSWQVCIISSCLNIIKILNILRYY